MIHKYAGEISYILENFDFDRVKKVMDFLKWKWVRNNEAEVPSVGRLVEEARRLLEQYSVRAEESGESTIAGTGGFMVRANLGTGEEGEPRMFLSLEFQLASWDNYS